MVGKATLAIAPSTTDMMIPSAMVRMAHFRCGCGRPSACSITAVVSPGGVLDGVIAVLPFPGGAYRQPAPAGPVPGPAHKRRSVRNPLGALLLMRDDGGERWT